ncbi:TRAP transporter small permease [Alicycliphilus denitrificans]|uniref:TRAP transporter small permease n=1 Tax=Alicycliphilus denitrificans TaxID=179636 RepID=UPI000A581E82|nr:TRAP transporter small permease [Alicycliphilus denitrificans]MBN9574530.1 TRAP transporter small permease [Alicycliphilus denitrificans]
MQILIRRLEQVGLALAGLCICLVMLTVSADALMRYALHAPMQWATDVTSFYLLVGAAYLAISSTFTAGDHININLLHQRMPVRLRAVTDALCALAYLAVFALVGWLAWETAVEALHNQEYMPGYIEWPVWLSYLPIPLGTGILCLRLVHHIFMLLTRGQDPHVVQDHGLEGGVE